MIEECNDIEEATNQQDVKCLDSMRLISTEKIRRHKSDRGPTFNGLYDGGSICTTSSMLSLISMPNKSEDNARVNIVSISSFSLPLNALLLTSIQLMWYQKKRGPMEQFLQKNTYCFSKKE